MEKILFDSLYLFSQCEAFFNHKVNVIRQWQALRGSCGGSVIYCRSGLDRQKNDPDHLICDETHLRRSLKWVSHGFHASQMSFKIDGVNVVVTRGYVFTQNICLKCVSLLQIGENYIEKLVSTASILNQSQMRFTFADGARIVIGILIRITDHGSYEMNWIKCILLSDHFAGRFSATSNDPRSAK